MLSYISNTAACGLSRISYAYLTWVAIWDRFFRQRANIGITRSRMRWYVRKIESIIGVQWGQKNPNPRAQRSSGKRGLPESWDFSVPTEHQ